MVIPLLAFSAGALLVWLASRARDRRIVTHQIGECPPADSPLFPRVLGSLLGAEFTAGNRIELLHNGDAIFPAMLATIRDARRSVCFETFIYWSGSIGREFAESLAARSRAGVRVYLLFDYMGSLTMESDQLDLMREAGCEIVRFHPPDLLHPSRINNRTHRKLLVVDGAVGFTGGVGIGDEWRGDAQDRDHWRDTHARIQGPVVAQMQGIFMVNWTKARGRVETDEAFFPALAPAGESRAQMFHSSPDDGGENIRLLYLLGIASARRTICLTQAYFLPDSLCRQALAAAARRGVRVEILVPGPLTDSRIVRRASRGCWGELLEAGVRLHEFQPTNLHAKILVVDGVWCTLGSANFDNRSFRLNDEANLSVYDPAVAQALETAFAADLARSRRITLEDWRRRPLGERLREFLARRFRHLL
ncbi:MAG: cardiolipin synthase [Burkholderiales bacterium]|nr:cardiolipin synthase [Opitutaceae bacterium]